MDVEKHTLEKIRWKKGVEPGLQLSCYCQVCVMTEPRATFTLHVNNGNRKMGITLELSIDW